MDYIIMILGRIIVVVVFVLLAVYVGFAFVRERPIYRSPRSPRKIGQAMASRPLYGPDVRVEDFEANLRRWGGRNSPGAVNYVKWWVLETIKRGEQPRKVDVKRLRKGGQLMRTDEEGRALFPGAFYELKEVSWWRVFFRRNLTLAGWKDYRQEAGEILARALDQKCLSASDAALMWRIQCLQEATRRGKLYGGPGLPYPDVRYSSTQAVHGEILFFYFDELFRLVVVQREWRDEGEKWNKEVRWERPGARQPEVYQEQ